LDAFRQVWHILRYIYFEQDGTDSNICNRNGVKNGYFETVKAEMNGLTPGLDRSPPPRWMGGQGGQSLKVFGRTRSFWGLSSPKIEMGGKALKWLSRLDYPLAKTGETVNGGAESAVHLDR
jgi:hypothetical protein